MKKRTKLGVLLAKRRIDLGITLKDMTAQINVAPSFLYGMEAGTKKPPPKHAQKLFEHYFNQDEESEFLQAFAQDIVEFVSRKHSFNRKALNTLIHSETKP